MKVLLITRRFPPSVGGMERYAFDLYTALNKQVDISLVKWGGTNKWLHVALLPYFFVRGFWVLLTQKIDIIHMQDGVLAPIGYTLHVIFRKPFVVVIHGLDITYQNPIFKTIVPWAVKRADKVICISSAARAEVLKRGIPADKAIVITLGVDDVLYSGNKKEARSRLLQYIGKDENTKLLVSVGRLVKRKGIAWFIHNVMPTLVKDNPNTVLLVSGDGEDRENIESAISEQNLENNVVLLGRTSDEVRRDLYNGSDVFIMPNISVPGDLEGFGLVLTEAATCQLPVVAAGIEGIRDAVVDGKNGFLVESGKPEQFIQKISELLGDPKAAAEFGEQARQFTLAHYDWQIIAERFSDEYAKLTGK